MAGKQGREGVVEQHVRVMERSLGFYWRRNAEKRLYGPFSTLLEVLEDVQLEMAWCFLQAPGQIPRSV